MRKIGVLFLVATLIASGSAFAQTTPALKIVVLKGEDAVNIIQQKTAVAPIVEVRDRNDLPVPGATVTFALSGQGASFAGGAQTLTVVTNAAGQATAAGLTPTAAGALNISATATFQGQTAIATITQTTVQTAAQAAGTAGSAASSGGASGGSSGAAGGGAGGGAGGMSGTTLGIIGGVAGVGAIAGVKAASGGDSPSSTTSTTSSTSASTTPTTPAPTATTPATTTAPPATTPAPTTPTPTFSQSSYAGPMDGSFSGSSTSSVNGQFVETCNYTEKMTGTSTLRTTGGTNGTLEMTGREVVTANSCPNGVSGLLADEPFTWSTPVTVSGNNITFSQSFTDSGNSSGFAYTSVSSVSFTGTVSSSGISGTLTMSSNVNVSGQGVTITAKWSGTMPLNLK